jgi:hypothetical protein
VALLGVYHGVNPGMGWLFAVARGLQEGRRVAVLQSLLPIAIGHEASVGLAVLLVAAAQVVAAPDLLRPVGAAVLLLFGAYKLLRPRSHPRWVGMRVSLRELALWSFLMSTAHGAGLMLLPVILGWSAEQVASDLPIAQDIGAVFVHTLAMLLAMGVIAVIVYERLGLGVLRRAWINVELLWAVAVVAAGVVTLFT